MEENRADVNFVLVERLQERELRDWTYFGGLRHEQRKKLRDPQDMLIEADRLRQQQKSSGQSDAELRNNRAPLASCLALANLSPLQGLIWKGKQNLW